MFKKKILSGIDKFYAIYITNLHESISVKELEDLYSPFGEIDDIHIYNKIVSEKGRAASVRFTKIGASDTAVQQTRFMNYKGRTLKVSLKVNPNTISPDFKIYVSNFSLSTTEKELYEHIIKHVNVYIFTLNIKDEVAEVQFYQSDDAKFVVERLNGSLLGGRTLIFSHSKPLNFGMDSKKIREKTKRKKNSSLINNSDQKNNELYKNESTNNLKPNQEIRNQIRFQNKLVFRNLDFEYQKQDLSKSFMGKLENMSYMDLI